MRENGRRPRLKRNPFTFSTAEHEEEIMFQKMARRQFAGFLITAALTAAALTSPADGPAPGKNTARYEIDFLTGMIDHHAMAVMTAELCTDRAVHEELRTMCEEIIATQSQEIELMRSWLQDWYGIAYEPQMKRGHHKQIARMAQLTGAEFEMEFMMMMIRHHEGAIREGSKCIDRAYHPELIELCENIVQAQAEEIAVMEDWLCEWYGMCE
jgi:uncharacterized protein (DUF305 family)